MPTARPIISRITLILAVAVALAGEPREARAGFRFSLVAAADVAQRFTEIGGTKSKSDGLLGYGAGALGNFDLSGSWLGGEVGALYLRRIIGLTDGTSVFLPFLEVPVLLRLNLGRISLGAGGYAGIGVGKVTVKASDGASTQFTYDSVGWEKTDAGLCGSLAMTFPLGTSTALVVDARYTHGLKNLSKVDGVRATLRDMMLLAGIRF